MKIEIGKESLFWCVVLAVLLLLLCLWGNGDIPFLSVNEARRAVTVREMYEANNWLLPYMNGSLYLAKPPLFYWLTLVPVHLLGEVSEWAMRLPSALFALSCLTGVYLLGSKLGGRQVGIFAAIFLAANAGFSMFARRAEIEMSLTGLCLLSLLSAWPYLFGNGSRRWVLLSYTILGCCLLTKGPVSLLFVSIPILIFALLQSHQRAKAFLCDGLGWLVALLIGGSWYFAVTLQEGWGVWQSILQQDIVDKVSGDGGEPWYSYLAYLAGDFFPFWLVLFIRPRQLWQKIRTVPEFNLLACAALVPLLIFSLFTDKHAKYLLPTYPVIALLLAYHWVRVLTSVQGWWRSILTWLPPLTLICFVSFYAVFERQVFAYRVQALPGIRVATAANPAQTIYSLGPPDMRLVFYAGRSIQELTEDQVRSHASRDAQLFVMAPPPTTLSWLSRCATKHFKPYLKSGKEALLIQLGNLCQNAL
ncbi:glycosyltransferase family 39 protein [Pseudomonas sp. 2FE]|uniref:ArnT family glycosyltransferase n=1 Tax=Pseudomonas sp. 2FE TaxID=2502190 RepID=UPI0010F4AE55|nr:glycosyltransferase family 39 protein [Pseudomonas sp. 2FE]